MVVLILENYGKCTRCMKSRGFYGAKFVHKAISPFFRYILNILLLDSGKYPRIIRKICPLSRVFLCLQSRRVYMESSVRTLDRCLRMVIPKSFILKFDLQSDVKIKFKMSN